MERDSHTLLVPVAAGELLDKITILRLKEERLQRQEALANVRRELQALEAVLNEAVPALSIDGVIPLTDALQAINTQLWDVEDGLRLLEAEQRFDQEFVALARSVSTQRPAGGAQAPDQRSPDRPYKKRKATRAKAPEKQETNKLPCCTKLCLFRKTSIINN